MGILLRPDGNRYEGQPLCEVFWRSGLLASYKKSAKHPGPQDAFRLRVVGLPAKEKANVWLEGLER